MKMDVTAAVTQLGDCFTRIDDSRTKLIKQKGAIHLTVSGILERNLKRSNVDPCFKSKRHSYDPLLAFENGIKFVSADSNTCQST